jgi:hypothetical protein
MTAVRKRALLILLGVLLLPVLWRGLRPAPPAGLSEPAEPARSLPAPRVGRAETTERVEELRTARTTFSASLPGRDPWRFVEAPVAAVNHAQKKMAAPVSMMTESVAPAPAIGKPAPVPFPWQYLGTFGPAGRRIAVFADPARRGEVHNAREGEALTQGFVLERIGRESVDVRRGSSVGVEADPAQRLLPGGRTSS